MIHNKSEIFSAKKDFLFQLKTQKKQVQLQRTPGI